MNYLILAAGKSSSESSPLSMLNYAIVIFVLNVSQVEVYLPMSGDSYSNPTLYPHHAGNHQLKLQLHHATLVNESTRWTHARSLPERSCWTYACLLPYIRHYSLALYSWPKALRLSSVSRAKIGVGVIISHLQMDCSNISDGTCRISKNKRYCDVPVPRRPVLASLRATLDTYLPHLPLSRLLSGAVVVNNVWGIPVQLATALVLLQQQLGYSAFTGLFVMLAFAPLHYAIIR